MNGPKRVRRIQSVKNNTNVYMIMGGLAPSTGIPNATWAYRQQQATICECVPRPGLENLAGIKYMKEKDIMSKNPACSGGVGRKKTSCNVSLRW